MREYFLWLSKILTLLVIVFVLVPLFFAFCIGVTTAMMKQSPGGADPRKAVAVVELTGEIMSAKDVVEQIYREADNKEVKGIVLRIDSPGGAVGPSQDVYNAVLHAKSKKPVVASMGTVAASGGLYSALGATKIFCQPGTLTGSIGVIMQVPNFSKIAEKLGVDIVTVKSGKLKDVGNPFRQMEPEERQFLEDTVHKVYDDFLNAVVTSRKIPRDKAVEFADGRVIVGSEAKTLGLVDEFGDVYDAARAVFEIIGEPLPEGKVPQLRYEDDKLKELRHLFRSATAVVTGLNPLQPRATILYMMQ
ncbi:MAG: signal peptide peptidase SppA [Proteobacteria bacterium]|nr:signal peptide peptidase SppA [Pseudomonadota bacterium]